MRHRKRGLLAVLVMLWFGIAAGGTATAQLLTAADYLPLGTQLGPGTNWVYKIEFSKKIGPRSKEPQALAIELVEDDDPTDSVFPYTYVDMTQPEDLEEELVYHWRVDAEGVWDEGCRCYLIRNPLLPDKRWTVDSPTGEVIRQRILTVGETLGVSGRIFRNCVRVETVEGDELRRYVTDFAPGMGVVRQTFYVRLADGREHTIRRELLIGFRKVAPPVEE